MAGRFSVESIFKAVDRVTAPVSRMQRNVSRFTRAAARGLHRVNRASDAVISGFMSVGRTALKLGTVGLAGLTGAALLTLKAFSKIENAQAAFTPLMGGAAKAQELVEAINETAASTPFQFENLAGAVNELLPVMNGNIGKTIKTLRMLGDTAGGNADKLQRIVHGYTKAMLKGKVDMESLDIIAEAGVPIYQELAKAMGVKPGKRFFKMISAGRATTDQLTKALQNLTSKGGKFYKGMDIASKTMTGLWSTLMDNITLTAASIGSILAPTIKDLIKKATDIAQRVRAWVKANKELIAAKFNKYLDAAKSALVRFVAWVRRLNKQQSIMDRLVSIVVALSDAFEYLKKHGATIGKIIASVVALIAALKILSGVMTIVNIVMAANPVGLIVLGIAALIAAVAAVIIWWDDLKKAFESLPGPVKMVFAVITAPIRWLIGAGKEMIDNWGSVVGFFRKLWGQVTGIFDAAIQRIDGVVGRVRDAARRIVDTISRIGGGVAKFFGFDDAKSGRPIYETRGRHVVGPHERAAQTVNENRTTNSSEVTIKDETGRASVTRGKLGAGVTMQQTGGW